MKQSFTKERFIYEFLKVRPDNFSRDGLSALFDFIEEIEEQDGKEVEFDPIAFCVEFTEYEDLQECIDNYGINFTNMQQLSYHTILIPIDHDRFIIADF